MNPRRPCLRSALPHPPGSRSAGILFTCAGLLGIAVGTIVPVARADPLGYLVNITVRPGYNFGGADQALSYGYGICDKVSQGRTYAQIMGDVKTDFNTSDDYQASYLVAQAVDELCPALLWQLRNSAAHYTPPPGSD